MGLDVNAARAKVEAEDGCRVCTCGPEQTDAAHVWDRSLGGPGFDDPDSIVPLCSLIKGGAGHHDEYDAHRLDLLPYMTTAEQVALVRNAGTIERARRRALGKGRRAEAPRPDDGPF